MIYLGSDHGGFTLKNKIMEWLKEWGYESTDLGNKANDPQDDYSVFALLVAQKVGQGEESGNKYPSPCEKRDKGILLCRSAAGMVIAANKVKNVRAVAVFDSESAKHCRLHNDANIIALSGDWTDDIKAKVILKVWLETEFSGEERHNRRLKYISDFEK